jgi:hypothetical protein
VRTRNGEQVSTALVLHWARATLVTSLYYRLYAFMDDWKCPNFSFSKAESEIRICVSIIERGSMKLARMEE